jgi:2-phosphosulfolactate phosphatase
MISIKQIKGIHMHIQKLHTPEKVTAECVVVIDVLRAFTTAAYAFAAGADNIIPVSTQEEAFDLKNQYDRCLIMGGDSMGKRIEGFDVSNSPTEIRKLDLTGYTIILRTPAGTQGIVRSLTSQKILITSFAVAEATLQRIRVLNPTTVTFVITGKNNGDEDLALADYLDARIQGTSDVPLAPFIERVHLSPAGNLFTANNELFPFTDLEAAVHVDAFPFAMELFIEQGVPVIYAVDAQGNKLRNNF